MKFLTTKAEVSNKNCFENGSLDAYQTARGRGLLDKICKHMNESWTDDMLRKEAAKYHTTHGLF